MQLYNYDESGYYTKTTTAKLDPIANQPMIPARATANAIPNDTLESYQKFKFLNDVWSVENVQSIVDTMLVEVNAKGTLLKEADVNGEPVARDVEDIALDDDEHDKKVLRDTAYAEMQQEVYDNLEITFGTRKSETATASAMTWDLMSAEPAEYSALGLKSEFELVGLSVGDALDTDAKISDYSAQLIANKLAYSKYRLTRIAQYTAEIVAIG